MVYSNLNKVCANIIENKYLFWRMLQKDDKTLIAECVNVENLNSKVSSEILQREIEALEGTGYVIVRVYKEAPKQGGNNTQLVYNIRIGEEVPGQNISGYASQNNSGFNMQTFNMMQEFNNKIAGISLDLEKEKHKAELKAMEDKFKTGTGEIDPYIKEIVGIAKMAFIKQGAAQEPVTTHQPINGIQERQEFAATILKWNKADANYLQAMKAIAHFATVQPNEYKEQVSLLINLYKNQ